MLMVETDVGGMTADVVDKLSCASDVVQPRQVDLYRPEERNVLNRFENHPAMLLVWHIQFHSTLPGVIHVLFQHRIKVIKREFSNSRTPQQNGIVERKNRIFIEGAGPTLADSLLPIPYWAEAVNTTCYVQNRVLATKPHNKTPYELLIGRAPIISFMRPVGYVPSSNEEVQSSPKDDAGKKSIIELTCVEGGNIDDLGCLDQQMKSIYDSKNTNSTNSFNTASLTVNTTSDKDGTFQKTSDKVYKVEKALYGLHQAPRA
nr:putative ribonuclease H-like domain-containing protein [Tanacetum cinerariifolium]